MTCMFTIKTNYLSDILSLEVHQLSWGHSLEKKVLDSPNKLTSKTPRHVSMRDFLLHTLDAISSHRNKILIIRKARSDDNKGSLFLGHYAW